MANPDTLDGWADKLDLLLRDAAAAKQSGDGDRIHAVQVQLRLFKEESPGYADALDSLATYTILDLDLGQAEAAVKSIRSRSEEIYRLKKMIDGVASEARRSANLLEGKSAIEALDAASSAIRSFRRLREDLKAGDASAQQLAAEVDKAIAAVADLRLRLDRA